MNILIRKQEATYYLWSNNTTIMSNVTLTNDTKSQLILFLLDITTTIVNTNLSKSHKTITNAIKKVILFYKDSFGSIKHSGKCLLFQVTYKFQLAILLTNICLVLVQY